MHRRTLTMVATLVGWGASAGAAPDARKLAPPAPLAAWIGAFHPQPACPTACTIGGTVRVLPGGDDAPPLPADVAIVQPLANVMALGTVDHDQVAVVGLAFDPARDGGDSVLVVPAVPPPAIVKPTPAELAAIKAVIARDEALAGVKKALVGLEIGAVDVEGNGTADFAVAYGCRQWADGQCQGRGQFFLARRGARWVELE
jgi:hypothetical protein